MRFLRILSALWMGFNVALSETLKVKNNTTEIVSPEFNTTTSTTTIIGSISSPLDPLGNIKITNRNFITEAAIRERIISGDEEAQNNLVAALLYLRDCPDELMQLRMTQAWDSGTTFSIVAWRDFETMIENSHGGASYSPALNTVTTKDYESKEALIHHLAHEFLGHAADSSRWLSHQNKTLEFSSDCYRPEDAEKILKLTEAAEKKIISIHTLLKKERTNPSLLTSKETSRLKNMRSFFVEEKNTYPLNHVIQTFKPGEPRPTFKTGEEVPLKIGGTRPKLGDKPDFFVFEGAYTHPKTGVTSYIFKAKDPFKAAIDGMTDALGGIRATYAPREHAHERIVHLYEHLPRKFINEYLPEIATHIEPFARNHPKTPVLPRKTLPHRDFPSARIAIYNRFMENPKATFFIDAQNSTLKYINDQLDIYNLQGGEATQAELDLFRSFLADLFKYWNIKPITDFMKEARNYDCRDEDKPNESVVATLAKVQFFSGHYDDTQQLQAFYLGRIKNTSLLNTEFLLISLKTMIKLKQFNEAQQFIAHLYTKATEEAKKDLDKVKKEFEEAIKQETTKRPGGKP